ncbi:hypothetical protein ACS6O0_00005, partial [Enterobacter hormaechei subsp. steigerwaltii]|uniref:hypothetical protein n=1 Tax=Enterobacter hormaechei TaxID=158836 RepID=UPI003F43FA34
MASAISFGECDEKRANSFLLHGLLSLEINLMPNLPALLHIDISERSSFSAISFGSMVVETSRKKSSSHDSHRRYVMLNPYLMRRVGLPILSDAPGIEL